jgi:hypothetical protein
VFRTPDLQAVLFFALFILTDPPTSPVRYRDQMVFAVIVAVASCAIFEWMGAVYYLLAGVLIGNLWEAWRRSVNAAACFECALSVCVGPGRARQIGKRSLLRGAATDPDAVLLSRPAASSRRSGRSQSLDQPPLRPCMATAAYIRPGRRHRWGTLNDRPLRPGQEYAPRQRRLRARAYLRRTTLKDLDHACRTVRSGASSGPRAIVGGRAARILRHGGCSDDRASASTVHLARALGLVECSMVPVVDGVRRRKRRSDIGHGDQQVAQRGRPASRGRVDAYASASRRPSLHVL